MQQAMVNPITHGFRRPDTSEIAPNTGIDKATSADATAFAIPTIVFVAPRSVTNHTVKYNVAMFIEKMVLAKSYIAQLHRSRRGARVARISPPVITGREACVVTMRPCPDLFFRDYEVRSISDQLPQVQTVLAHMVG